MQLVFTLFLKNPAYWVVVHLSAKGGTETAVGSWANF
jgi:hypothetical protein